MKIFLAILAFIAVVFIRNLAFWTPSQSYIFGDTAIYSLQLVTLAKNLDTLISPKDSILGWNPNFLAVGVPALSIVDNGWLYPPNWIIAILALLTGNPLNAIPFYTISIFLHLGLSSFFVFKILREFWGLSQYPSLVGSLIWLASGFNTEFSAAAPIMLAGSYLPLTTYLALKSSAEGRKFFFPYFLALAASFLAGYPMVSIIVYIFSLVIKLLLAKETETLNKEVVLREARFQALGLFAVVLPLISPLYLQSYLNFPFTVRGPLKIEAFLQNPTPLLNIPEPLLPKNTFFNTLSNINYIYLYLSLTGLIIILQSGLNSAIFKKKSNAVIFYLGLIGLIISLGGVAFFPSLIYYSLPFLNVFRRLSVFTLIPSFCFSILVAERVTPFLQSRALSKISVFWLKILAFLVIYSQVLNIIYADAKDKSPFNFTYLYQSLFLTAIVTGLTYLPLVHAQANLRLSQAILIGALLIETGSNVASKAYLNSATNPVDIFRPNTLTNTLKKITKPMERLDVLRTQHSYNTDHLGLEQTQGYLSLASWYGVEIVEALNNPEYKKENLRSILGIRYIAGKDQLTDNSLTKLYEIKQEENPPGFYAFNNFSLKWEPEDPATKYYIYQNGKALPRIYTAKSLLGLPNQNKEILKNIAEFEDSRTVILNDTDLATIQKISDKSDVAIKEYKRNYLKAEVSSREGTLLANSTGYYPGWWVKINGKLTSPIQANWFMMGVYIPPGQNLVEFFYLPYGLLAGFFYLGAALMFWLFFLTFRVFKKAPVKSE